MQHAQLSSYSFVCKIVARSFSDIHPLTDVMCTLCVLTQEDQLGISLLTLEQLESEESLQKIESRIHQQWTTAQQLSFDSLLLVQWVTVADSLQSAGKIEFLATPVVARYLSLDCSRQKLLAKHARIVDVVNQNCVCCCIWMYDISVHQSVRIWRGTSRWNRWTDRRPSQYRVLHYMQSHGKNFRCSTRPIGDSPEIELGRNGKGKGKGREGRGKGREGRGKGREGKEKREVRGGEGPPTVFLTGRG